jgi:hypothetical protein
MRDWFEAQLAAGLPAFSGTSISGTLAIKQEAVNELLANWLAASATPEGAKPPFDVGRARQFLKSAAVRAEPGTLLVDFHVTV